MEFDQDSGWGFPVGLCCFGWDSSRHLADVVQSCSWQGRFRREPWIEPVSGRVLVIEVRLALLGV
jgi:hypothetical protein